MKRALRIHDIGHIPALAPASGPIGPFLNPEPGPFRICSAQHFRNHGPSQEDESAMSEGQEIEFESSDSPHWPQVKEGAHGVARDRLQTRYDAVIQGAQWFRDDADTLIKDAIKKPPGHLSGFGALAESLMAVCILVVPEVGLAAEILEAAKGAYETIKPAQELVEKAHEQAIANSVEAATGYLQELTKTYAEDVADKALPVKQAAENAVGAALDSYIQQNPQPLKPGDDSFYRSLCDGIGIREPDLATIKMEVWNKVFPPFKENVLVAAAQIHFFHEMDDDFERLNFLMDQAEKGTDPDALLVLMGGSREYWDPFLRVFRDQGRSAAMMAMEAHLLRL
jgi:hypothetical protein